MVKKKGRPAKDQSTDYDVDSLREAEREALADSLLDEYMLED